MPSAHELQRKRAMKPERTFAVDGKFLRDEAREAIRSYFMPFAGIYAAATGKDVRVVATRKMGASGRSSVNAANKIKNR